MARRARPKASSEEDDAPNGPPTGGAVPGAVPGAAPVCALCLRPIPADAEQSLHHLIPKAKGGRGGPTVLLHHLCHREIHAALAEGELARDFATPEALRAHPRLARFAAWVARRPPHFSSRVPRTGGRR